MRFDNAGRKLAADKMYVWDAESVALAEQPAGQVGADHIKMMRLMVSAPVEVVLRVRGADQLVDELSYIAKCIERATR